MSLTAFASHLNPYVNYNGRLVWLYGNDLIGYETLNRFWSGTPFSKVLLDQIIEVLELNRALHRTTSVVTGSKALVRPRVTGSYTPSSSTPILPFAGNQLVVLGGALFADDSNLASVTLRRQADCSLVEDVFEPVNNLLTPSSLVELPGIQDYLHTLAGLTTTPDLFPSGCIGDPTLGTTAVYTAQPVGVTENGINMVANLTDSGLIVREINTASNTASTITLARGYILAFTVADVNGDGLNDIVASNATDPATQKPAFATFLNRGDGTFANPVFVDSPGSILFTVDDVNGDGTPDIVVVNNSQFDEVTFMTTRSVTTFLGNGDGNFQAGVDSTTSAMGVSMAITGDFDGDGKKDLLTGNTLMLGAGDGTFTAGPPLPAAVQYETGLTASAAVGDFNQDGNLDIVYSGPGSGSGIVQVLLGNGDGTFQIGARYASLTPQQPVTVTDIDGDGNLDIAVGNSSQGLYVQDSNDNLFPMMQFLLGRGDGTFAGAPVYTQQSIATFATADFNGDGHLDVLAYSANNNGPGSLMVLPGDGVGNFGAAIGSPVNVASGQIVAADMNGDGMPDAVLAGISGNPRLSVLTNQGNGKFSSERDYVLPNYSTCLAVADFNGDGLMDVAVGVGGTIPGTSATTGVYVLLGRADGTLGAPALIDSSLYPSSLAVRDLNGDGRADLVVADQGFFSPGGRQVNGGLHVYLGNPDGTFTSVAVPSTSATNYSLVALGDLDGDGKLDLIAAGNVAGNNFGVGTPNLYTFFGNGDGTFGAAQVTPLAGTDGIGAQSIALADFNGDGKLDVAVGNPNDFTEVLLGFGDGTFGKSLMALGQQPQALGAADLDGDGLPELLLGGRGGLAVFKNAAAWPPLN
jgi:hypothetical protein